MKTCKYCEIQKEENDFVKGRGNTYRNICKICKAFQEKQYKEANKEYVTRQRRNITLKRYGITVEEYDEILIKQNGKCAICQSTDTRPYDNFCVDHCHETGRVRGLLCVNCNTGLGKFNDNINILSHAITYLSA